jgi:soluble calcium-activated nucleotidase 1
LGGYGKEYTDPFGNYWNDKPLWIKIVDRFGHLRNVYWGREFKALRGGIGIHFPGYMIFECKSFMTLKNVFFSCSMV